MMVVALALFRETLEELRLARFDVLARKVNGFSGPFLPVPCTNQRPGSSSQLDRNGEYRAALKET